ncbi:MAG: M14 family zinc carboxypeptidase [Phycisphaerales bacterium]
MPKSPSLALLLAATLALPALAHDDHAAPSSSTRFDNHRVVRVNIASQAELDRMLAISDDFLACEPHRNQPLEFRVSPEQFTSLQASGLTFEVLSENFQADLDAHRADLASAPDVGPDGVNYFAGYRDYDTTSAYIDTLIALNPSIASRFTVGNSIEGRDIFGIRITGPGAPGSKPGFHVQSIQHAREWAVLPVSMWFADQLIRQYGVDPALTQLVNSIEIYIVPIVNPDGYIYTWGPNRQWRKNRRPNAGGSFGVDLNRNWGYGWGGTGSSGTPSSDTYRGTAPFSEPETTNISNFLLAHPNIRAIADLHANGQTFLMPWGNENQPSPIHGENLSIVEAMTAASQAVNGVVSPAGPSGVVLYLSSGNVRDWCYDGAGIYPTTIEVRDTGNGFTPPVSAIAPTNAENFAALKVMAEWVRDTNPVRFEFAAIPPAFVQANTPAPISIKAWSINGPSTLDSSSVNLRWRRGVSGPFSSLSMNPGANDTFSTSIPAMACAGGVIQYYFEASTTSAQTDTWPANAPANFYSVPIGDGGTILADNFTNNMGWTVGATGDTASQGVWTRVDPATNAAQPEVDNPLGTGTSCYITGQTTSTTSPLLQDVDGGATSLVSPIFNAIGDGQLWISYFRWFTNNLGSNRHQATDDLSLYVSNDGGANWTLVESYNDCEGKWTYRAINLSQFITPTANTRVRFVARDSSPDSCVEAGIDDVSIVLVQCDSIPGDINGDGVVNFADLNILLSNFGLSGPGIPGDITGDGNVNFADLNILLSNFGAGA